MSTREIFREFEALLEESQKCFNKLRDLPPYGNSRWEHHFHKAFHVYSKLWKFQQEHRCGVRRPAAPVRGFRRRALQQRSRRWSRPACRAQPRPHSSAPADARAAHRPARREVLTSRGMERWEIGDIASKIGQLYYNYYLRTSEIRFLSEAHVFYEAIRSRSYFAQAATDPNLAIKQLRYFARFIIICLLLNRREEVWQLLQEFQALISSYVMKYSPPDAAEWRAVIQEVTTFLHADVAMPVPRSPGAALPFRVSLRCGRTAPEVKLAPHRTLLLPHRGAPRPNQAGRCAPPISPICRRRWRWPASALR